MESRKITIVSTKTQKKSVIMSGAETLAELKRDLRESGIDYDDMTFYEGTSKTELKTDESVLPKDVPYTNRTTGETKNTNELVFMLTNTNKKIKSGATLRTETFKAIKELNLQRACIDKYGKNFTQCSTNDLIALIEENKVEPVTASANCDEVAPVAGCIDTQARAALNALVDALYNEGDIDYDTKNTVLNILGGVTFTACENCKTDSPYSDNEIDNMFNGMY